MRSSADASTIAAPGAWAGAGAETIALLGFGEAAEAIAGGWSRAGRTIATYDVKLDAETTADPLCRRARASGVEPMPRDGALGAAGLVVSLVTAEAALEAARQAAPHLKAGALYVDGNSCAPRTKAAAAAEIEAAGGRYVDMAIMAPVRPKRQLTPVLLAGPHAPEAVSLLTGLGMRPTLAGETVGQASAVKMARSVMIKGLEALMAECFLTARRSGVEEAVLASLEASDPDIAWRRRGAYALDRMMVHGRRRAAEMREVAATVEGVDLPPLMTRAAVEWQQRIGDLALDPGEDRLEARLDALLAVFD